MRYLRLQRSQANRRRAEREAERTLHPGAQTVQHDGTAREYPAPAEPETVLESTPEPRKRKSG